MDSYKRVIDYLRISVTDRCNLRCVYCMPPGGIPPLPHDEILTYEEIIHITRLTTQLGIRKIRLTGGEPLVRRDLPFLIKELSSIEEIKDISLTTNGIMLASMARSLKEAGLQRVNVSMDSLDPQRYRSLTRGGSFGSVWDGLMAAYEAGLAPIKINVVPIEGLNSDEILPFAELTLKWPFDVRFIEWMPMGESPMWSPEAVVWGERILDILQGAYSLVPASVRGNGPAEVYRIPGGKGTVGVIRAMTRHFCRSCNRLRLTPDGRMRTCLFSDGELDLKELVRSGASDSEIKDSILACIKKKPPSHEISIRDNRIKKCMRSMNRIGG